MNKRLATFGLAAGLIGGGAGLAFGVPAIASAASTTATPAATTPTTPAAGSSSTATPPAPGTWEKDALAPLVKNGTITQAQADAVVAALEAAHPAGGPGGHGGRGPGGPGGPGGHNEAVSDESVAAKAIGISEADLKTALDSGQSLAAVAKAHSVDPQKVIDALVADEQSEADAAVKAGTMTQAQADARKADMVQHITDRVNGVRPTRPAGAPDAPANGSSGSDSTGSTTPTTTN